MDDMSGIMKSIIKSAEAANKPEEGDYYDEDGFLVCGNCHTRRQVEIDMPDLKGSLLTQTQRSGKRSRYLAGAGLRSSAAWSSGNSRRRNSRPSKP